MHDLLTIISGLDQPLGSIVVAVFGFVVSQWYLKMYIEPIKEWNTLRGKVASALMVYDKAFTLDSSDDFQGEAKKYFRDLAGDIGGAIENLPKPYRKEEYFSACYDLAYLPLLIGGDDYKAFGDTASDIRKFLGLLNSKEMLKLRALRGIVFVDRWAAKQPTNEVISENGSDPINH